MARWDLTTTTMSGGNRGGEQGPFGLPWDVGLILPHPGLTKGSASRSQQTLMVRLVLPSLSGPLPTRKGSVDSSAPLFTRVSDRDTWAEVS